MFGAMSGLGEHKMAIAAHKYPVMALLQLKTKAQLFQYAVKYWIISI